MAVPNFNLTRIFIGALLSAYLQYHVQEYTKSPFMAALTVASVLLFCSWVPIRRIPTGDEVLATLAAASFLVGFSFGIYYGWDFFVVFFEIVFSSKTSWYEWPIAVVFLLALTVIYLWVAVLFGLGAALHGAVIGAVFVEGYAAIRRLVGRLR